MNLNELNPAKGANKSRMRVGRGLAKKGKTCGSGHKGQLSRGSGKVRLGFESGHVSLLNRIPKFGFSSRKSLTRVDLPLFALNAIDASEHTEITLEVLKKHNLISNNVLTVKFYLKGEVKGAYHLKGLAATKGALAAIEKAKGSMNND